MVRLGCLIAALAGLGAPAAGSAQVTPVFTAPMVHGSASAPQGGVPVAREPLSPATIVRLFESACIATNGQSGAAIDWALANGFEPVDVMRGSMESLLGGKPGTVLVAPDSGGNVMLVAGTSQCSLWADLQEGPPLRTALAAMVGTLAAKGARTQVQLDRNLERAGAWRSQVQWRYRAVGGSNDLGIGAVTTLSNGLATQMLHVAPLANAVTHAPDGMPLR